MDINNEPNVALDDRAEIANARFLDGVPQNLAAASLDALEWMQWCQSMMPSLPHNRNTARELPRALERIGRAIQAMETYLAPHLPAQFDRSADTVEGGPVMQEAQS